jgi:hypothetical protein
LKLSAENIISCLLYQLDEVSIPGLGTFYYSKNKIQEPDSKGFGLSNLNFKKDLIEELPDYTKFLFEYTSNEAISKSDLLAFLLEEIQFKLNKYDQFTVPGIGILKYSKDLELVFIPFEIKSENLEIQTTEPIAVLASSDLDSNNINPNSEITNSIIEVPNEIELVTVPVEFETENVPESSKIVENENDSIISEVSETDLSKVESEKISTTQTIATEQKKHKEEKKKQPIFLIILLVVLFLLCTFIFYTYKNNLLFFNNNSNSEYPTPDSTLVSKNEAEIPNIPDNTEVKQVSEIEEIPRNKGEFYLIAGSFSEHQHAVNYATKLKSSGQNPVIVLPGKFENLYKVCLINSNNRSVLIDEMVKYKENNTYSWILD